jgi:hypothetical protein
MAEEPQQQPTAEDEQQRWLDGEDRFWKLERRRHGVWKNVAWLIAGIGLAVLLNLLGCPGFLPT